MTSKFIQCISQSYLLVLMSLIILQHRYLELKAQIYRSLYLYQYILLKDLKNKLKELVMTSINNVSLACCLEAKSTTSLQVPYAQIFQLTDEPWNWPLLQAWKLAKKN